MNFPNEAQTPTAANFREAIYYFFHENERRATQSTKGLTQENVNHDPGHGSWSIGMLIKHQLDLIGLMTNNLTPGAIKNIQVPEIGEEGNWNLQAMISHRETLAQCFLETFAALPEEKFMDTRPGVYPPHWEEWPVIMRMLRPLLDISTHIGQVNYARRQQGNPISTP
jgi:hypothetical protein